MGAKATESTSSEWPGEREQFLPGGRVPELDGLVESSRGQALAVAGVVPAEDPTGLDLLAAKDSPLKKGEAIAFFGDSITAAGAGKEGYCRLIVNAITAGRPELEVKAIYAGIGGKVAADTNTEMCDLRKAFIEHLEENNPEKKRRGILTSDGVHLNPAGNRFVANHCAEAIAAALKKRK